MAFILPLNRFVTREGKGFMTQHSAYEPVPYVKLTHPEWSKNATIYQINTRQFTPEGTFRAAEAHLPRLKDLGVVIIWLMPVHPIGEKNRKGSLGSPYAVKDYYGVNAEFGTLDDLKHFVQEAHALGMYVILDWVANHTAWDCVLVDEHPEWYARDWKGDFRPTPWWDWVDIIDLDYDKPALREYMTEALKYWVREADVDGYRCDVAGFVPLDFWNNARKELDAIKPVFMLAEWETRDLHEYAFDMTYGWSWNSAMHQIAMGKADVNLLYVYYAWNEKAFAPNSMRMLFTSNHDKNSWDGTEYEQFGDCLEAAMVLSVISDGMPLIYNGQEAGNKRRLAFFEKDPLEWQEHPYADFYRKLFTLKRENSALWNGSWGALMVNVFNNVPSKVLSFVRQNEQEKIFAVFNLSASAHTVSFVDTLFVGTYTDFFSGATVELAATDTLELEPWSYRVFLAHK
jgi:glycosidase